MKKLSIFVLTTLLVSSVSLSTIHRVCYSGLARVGAYFSSFNEAENDSTAGDIWENYK